MGLSQFVVRPRVSPRCSGTPAFGVGTRSGADSVLSASPSTLFPIAEVLRPSRRDPLPTVIRRGQLPPACSQPTPTRRHARPCSDFGGSGKGQGYGLRLVPRLSWDSPAIAPTLTPQRPPSRRAVASHVLAGRPRCAEPGQGLRWLSWAPLIPAMPHGRRTKQRNAGLNPPGGARRLVGFSQGELDSTEHPPPIAVSGGCCISGVSQPLSCAPGHAG